MLRPYPIEILDIERRCDREVAAMVTDK